MKNNFRDILFFLLVFLLQNQSLKAQQLPLIAQHRASLNPAHISSGYFKYDTRTEASIRYRYQWTKLKGAPKTMIGNFSHFDEETQFLFGGDIISDKTGPTGFIGLNGRASYAINLNRDLLLSFGLRGGVTQYRVRGDDLNFLEPGDVANNNVTKIFPDFSLGAMLYWQENYYIGFSVPQVFSLNLSFKDDINKYNIQRVRHYYGIAGARFDMGSDSWIEGSAEARYVQNVPFYMNFKFEYEFRQIFWINATGSTAKEIGIGAGVIANVGGGNVVKFGYNFSNFFQTYGSEYGTVHELGVQIYW